MKVNELSKKNVLNTKLALSSNNRKLINKVSERSLNSLHIYLTITSDASNERRISDGVLTENKFCGPLIKISEDCVSSHLVLCLDCLKVSS